MAREEKSLGTGKIDNLSDTLNSRTRYKDPLNERSRVTPTESPAVSEDWQGPELEEILSHERVDVTTMPFLKKFFIFAVLFFIATLGVAGFVFLGGNNFISSKNVDLSVTGPTEVSAGTVVELEVSIENDNNADLDLANFSVQYPSGSRDPEDSTKPITFSKENLGVVRAGDAVVRNARFILLGEKGETKELKLSLEYKVAGSNATFYKDKLYELKISDSPLSLSIQAPSSVRSGEVFTTTVSLSLNSTEVLKNVMLKAEYPYGYTSTEARPPPFSDKNVWSIGDLAPGSTKKIEITGKLLGENLDERTFRFYAGLAEGESPVANFKNVLLSTQKTVAVERPQVELRTFFNNSDVPTYVAPLGGNIDTVIRFRNNLSEKLMSPYVEVRISGVALNESSIRVYRGGFYDSSTKKIGWSIVGREEAEISPGEEGEVSFNFASVSDLPLGKSRDIKLEVYLEGTAVGRSEPIRVTQGRVVRIASEVNFSSKALFSSGPFKNRGTLPPRVEEETTYNILWSVGNTQSEIKDAKVTAKLGSAVRISSIGSSALEDLSYDDKTNMITWNLGTLASGAGFSGSGREVAFQVSLTPSLSQLGIAPVLVSGITFSGLDTVTGQVITVSSPALTTRLVSDPAFVQGDEIVTK